MYISREMLPSKGAQRAATHHAAMHDKCKKKTPKTIQTWLEKSWWACSGTEEARLFLSVYLKSGGSYYIRPPCTQRCQHEAIPSIWWVLRNFYWREKLAPLTSNVKLTQLGEPQPRAETLTQASGTGEWAGTPSPARPISKVLLELKPGFACVAAHLGWHPARAVPPVLSPAQAAEFGFHLFPFGNSHWSLCRIKRRGKTYGVINIYINWFYLISSFSCPCRANAWNISRSLAAATQPALGDHDVLSSPVLSLLQNCPAFQMRKIQSLSRCL